MTDADYAYLDEMDLAGRQQANLAVERGAGWLDSVWPNWWADIDLEHLNLGSASSCVLGQLAPKIAEVQGLEVKTEPNQYRPHKLHLTMIVKGKNDVVCGWDAVTSPSFRNGGRNEYGVQCVQDVLGVTNGECPVEFETWSSLGFTTDNDAPGLEYIHYANLDEAWKAVILDRREADADEHPHGHSSDIEAGQ